MRDVITATTAALAIMFTMLFANSSYERDMKICQLTHSFDVCVETLR
jgi:hypothetical protein